MLGTPGAIRTHDLLYRKQTLYPAELRVQINLTINVLSTPIVQFGFWIERGALSFTLQQAVPAELRVQII